MPSQSPELRIRFNGQDHHARADNRADLNFGADAFSLSVVFKAEFVASSNQRRYLLSKGSDGASHYCLYLNERGRLVFETGFETNTGLSMTAIKAASAITAGQVHYAIARRSASGAMDLYLDGALQASGGANSSGDVDNDRSLWIGSAENLENRGFTGEISEIALFNRALSETEASEDEIDYEEDCVLRLGDDEPTGPNADGEYTWNDQSGGGDAALRAEIIPEYQLGASDYVNDDSELGLVERLPPELRKTDVVRELFEAIDEYWRDHISLPARERLLPAQSIFDAGEEEINLKLEELTTYFDDYSRADAKPMSVVWKKEEIINKNSVAALEALLKRFKIPREYIVFSPLYWKKNETYGDFFYREREIDPSERHLYFLSSHVDLEVDHEKILKSDLNQNDLRKALERYFEENIRPTHIVFKGLTFTLKPVECVFQSIFAGVRKRRIIAPKLDCAPPNTYNIQSALRSLSAATQSGRTFLGEMNDNNQGYSQTVQYSFNSVSLAAQTARISAAAMSDTRTLS